VKIVNEKLEHENLTLQEHYQGIQKSRLLKISKILNGYLILSVLNFIPIFCGTSNIVCGNAMVAPFDFFFNICFPIGFLSFLWGAKLAVNLKEWRKFSFNLVKFAFPFPFVIQYYLVLQMMNLEVQFYSIWWLSFLK
jgi:hypothetical protein